MSAISNVRRAARVAGFAALTPTMLAGYSLRDAFPSADKSALRDQWFGAWCNAMMRVFGLRTIFESLPPPREKGRGRLVISNHRGVADVLVLLSAFGGRMVSRADLSRWPLIGLAGRKLGTVFVDRENRRSGAATIRAMRDLLRAGESITIFPEGTTFPGDEVRKFHPGGLSAAAGTGAEILPIGLAYSRDSQAAFLNETFPEHLSKMAAAPPSFVALSAGASFEMPEKARSAEFALVAHDAVQREVLRARALADRNER